MSTPADSDFQSLLVLAQAGDTAAVGEVLEPFRSYLSILARVQIGRHLQRKIEPADVVQDTFLEAHRDFGQFRGTTEGELSQWLRQILVRNLANLVRHYLGTQARDPRLERDLQEELDRSSRALDQQLVGKGSTPSQKAMRHEQTEKLADALNRLADDYQEVILLRHLEGLPFAEVARRMHRSTDSVDKLWVRALAQLRRLLKEPS
jgi:RNA polymerase sigma-70 factor (ECF subfamily)